MIPGSICFLFTDGRLNDTKSTSNNLQWPETCATKFRRSKTATMMMFKILKRKETMTERQRRELSFSHQHCSVWWKKITSYDRKFITFAFKSWIFLIKIKNWKQLMFFVKKQKKCNFWKIYFLMVKFYIIATFSP